MKDNLKYMENKVRLIFKTIILSLAILMLSRIRDILIISKDSDQILYKKILGNGKNLGLNIEYAVQEKADGIQEAFIIGEKFINNNKVALILGDNFFYDQNLSKLLLTISLSFGATYLASKYLEHSFSLNLFGSDKIMSLLSLILDNIRPHNKPIAPPP